MAPSRPVRPTVPRPPRRRRDGLEFGADPGHHRLRTIEEALQRGLLLLKAGIYSNCVRVLAPLVISDDELAEALDVWEEALVVSLAD